MYKIGIHIAQLKNISEHYTNMENIAFQYILEHYTNMENIAFKNILEHYKIILIWKP